MRLKRLELFGFKSFADRTHLDFEDMLTGIVGPNGCGKSNVVDAVRWVLGETRPTSMRGGEMADVVFKGSVSRPAMSVAEVTMVLDNTSAVIEDRGAEVSLTRRVFTSGEGEYLIDGERCRLKDIKNMLFDTGLGSRGYSVLEQGRIDAVLSANPMDRRVIFEEAAGISRYRQRRKEAESKLRRVSADLERLDDVLRELGSRVRSLKIQAGKAERFVAARDTWRGERSRSLKHRLFGLRAELAELERELGELEQKTGELRVAREAEEGDVAARELEQQSVAAEVDRLADEVARLAGESRASDERHTQLLARVEAWRASAQEEGDRALALAGQLEQREAELERLEGQAESSDAQVAEAREAHSAETERLKSVRQALAEARAESAEQNDAVLGALHAKTGAKNALHHLSELRPTLEEREARSAARIEGARESVEEARREAEARRAELAEAESALEECSAREGRLAGELEGLEERLARARTERAERRLERERHTSLIEALRDRERELEALEAGARTLLDGVVRGEGPCRAEDLAGLVADHLETSTELARALDAALGPLAQALVAREPGQLGPIVAWLASREAGQARVVVPQGLGGAGRRGELPPELAARVRGRLLDHVRWTPAYEELAELLVGDVLLVEDRERALELAREYATWRFVTPTGDCVDAAGIWGGHREITHGAVGRRARAAALESELERIDAALAAVEETLAGAGTERERLAAELGGARGALDEARGRRSSAAGELRAAEARMQEVEGHLGQIRREGESVVAELAQLVADIAAAEAQHAASQRDFEERNAGLERVEARRRELESEVEALQLEAGRREVTLTRLGAEREGLMQRARDLGQLCQEARTELERARRLAREHGESAERGDQEAVRVRAEGDKMLELRGETERKLDELRAAERAGREAIEAYRRRVDAATRELEGLGDQLAEQRLAEQRLRLAREELGVRAVEDLGLSEVELLDGFQPEDELVPGEALEELDRRVAGLKAELDRLGPVNTEAVDELEEAAGRFDFLTGQRKDLSRSQRSLAEAIAQIDRESERLFLETFDEVKGHFQTLFRQLFGGGRADIELAGEGSPLEAGIEITARPPGREMLPIGLLSGGQRTMTALALLFAVFRSRPSPFCVLDEVDAALDDANIGRFLGMLDSFRRDTQFIVVTHNKGSMAACERLYGITMQTKGVSTHVAVEFGEVDAFVPEATGNEEEARRARAEAPGAGSPEPEQAEPADTAAAGEPEYVLPRPEADPRVAAEPAEA